MTRSKLALHLHADQPLQQSFLHLRDRASLAITLVVELTTHRLQYACCASVCLGAYVSSRSLFCVKYC